MAYKEYSCCEPISDNDKIWRYMVFDKFTDLLDRKQLYFSSPRQFDDEFEGAVTIRTDKLRKAVLARKNPDPEILKNVLCALQYGQNILDQVGINCWHINNHESMAMWKLYLKSNTGIAIQTTFASLKKSFQEEKEDVFIGKVNYIDYQNDMLSDDNLFWRFLAKRKAYSYEQELRAIVFKILRRQEDGQLLYRNGKHINVSLEDLIENIFVEPTAPLGFFDSVKSVVKKYGLSENIVKYSELSQSPIY